MTALRMICIHCEQVLDAKSGDGTEVCRFCVKQFQSRCISCANAMPHGLEVAGAH